MSYINIGNVAPKSCHKTARYISICVVDKEKKAADPNDPKKYRVTFKVPIYEGDKMRPIEDIDNDKIRIKADMKRKNALFESKIN